MSNNSSIKTWFQRDPNVCFEDHQAHFWISVVFNYTLDTTLTEGESFASEKAFQMYFLSFENEPEGGQQMCHPTTNTNKSQASSEEDNPEQTPVYYCEDYTVDTCGCVNLQPPKNKQTRLHGKST